MMLTTRLHLSGFQFRPRHYCRVARMASGPPRGVLSNPSSTSQSFVKQHQEVLQDSEWYGPEAPDHAISPAAAAAAPATAATRGDLQLMNSFTKYIKSHKLDLAELFCTEAILSADSRLVCDPRSGHHGELLAEYLISGSLRVGEELPHWFVNGNLRGAIKCWMATRPGAAAAAAGPAALDERREALAALFSEHVPLGPSVEPLVDPLLAAMPEWRSGQVEELAGWEPSDAATAEDVALLSCFGAIVYSSRLDVAVFLQQLCGADPFSWVMAQVAQGVIAEPEAWLLEQFFMSRHSVGEPLPMWFAKWGVRQDIGRWLREPKAVQLVQALLEARGIAAPGADAAATLASAGAAAGASAELRDAQSAALDRAEASAAALLTSALSRHGITPAVAISAATVSCHRDVRLVDSADPSATPHAVDLLVTCPGTQDAAAAALLATAVHLPYSNGTGAADLVAAVRQAKERLNWLGFLMRREGRLGPQAALAKVLLLVEPEEGGDGAVAATAALPSSVHEYLEHHGVLCVRASELPTNSAA